MILNSLERITDILDMNVFSRLTICFLFLLNSYSIVLASELPQALVAPVSYSGADNIEITILMLADSEKPKLSNKAALIELLNHPAFGTKEVFLVDIIPGSNEEQFIASLRVPKLLVAKRVASYGNSYVVIPRVSTKGIYRLQISKESNKKNANTNKTESMINEYFGLKSASSKLEQSDIDKAIESMRANCQSKIALEIDSNSFPRKYLEQYNSNLQCANALSGISELCTEKLAREALSRKGINKIQCKFAPSPSIAIDSSHASSSVLKVNIAPASGEYSHRVKNYLNETL